MSKKFLTLNIGAANVELAEYELGARNALTLVNYGTAALSAPLDGGNAETILTPALLEIVREKGIHPGKVTMSVSGQMVFPRFVAIPMAGGADKFEQTIRFEIEQNVPFPIDEMVCDRQILGDTESGDKQVAIVAAKIDQIETLTSAVISAGFEPEIVDVAPIALINVIRHNNVAEGECVVLLDIGAKTTSLVIVDGDKIYNRSIPVAGNNITKEIATALGCSLEEAESLKREKGYVSMGGVTEDEDAVADSIAKVCRTVLTRLHAEISRSINFYRGQQHGGTPTKLYLTGGTALLPQIDTFFQESLNIAVEYFNPFGFVEIGPKVDTTALENDGALISTTIGLALHATGSAHFAINLLPPSLVEARAEKARIPFLIAGGAMLSMALVLVGLGFRNDAAIIEAQRDAVMVKRDSLKKFDAKIKSAEKDLQAAKDSAGALQRLLESRVAAVQRINVIRNAMVAKCGMWIEKRDANGITFRYWLDRSGDGKPLGELVADKIAHSEVVDPATKVNVNGMIEIGKDDKNKVRQFTVEFKFK